MKRSNEYGYDVMAVVLLLVAAGAVADNSGQRTAEDQAKSNCLESMAINEEQTGQDFKELCEVNTRSPAYWSCVIVQQKEGNGLPFAQAQCDEVK